MQPVNIDIRLVIADLTMKVYALEAQLQAANEAKDAPAPEAPKAS